MARTAARTTAEKTPRLVPNDDIGEEVRLNLFRTQLTIRQAEQRAYDLFLQNLVKGTSHLSLGQEAIAAGFAVAMRPGDLSFCTYRGHAHTLARGVPVEKVLGELMQRDNGLMRGKGGSMHLTSAEHGVMGSYAIIGAHLPIACGAAWRAQYKGHDDVVGLLLRRRHHQYRRLPRGAELRRGLEAAGRLRLREQSLHGIHADPLGDRGRASGRRPRRRPMASSASSSTATTPTRSIAPRRPPSPAPAPATGPSLIECMTYRHSGHSRADPGKYRPPGELEEWMKRDPIPLYREPAAASSASPMPSSRRSKREVKRDGRRRRPRPARRRRCRRPRSSTPTSMPMEAGHGGTDLSRRRRARHRAGDGARPRRRLPRRGRRRGRRRLQGDRRPARAVRPDPRPRHADLGAGDPRRRDGRGDDRPEADRRDHVLGLPRGLLRLHRQRVPQEPLHDQRPARLPAGRAHRQRRRLALRRPAQPERRELGDDDPRAQGRGAVQRRAT